MEKLMKILIIGSDHYAVDAAIKRGYDVVVVREFAATTSGRIKYPDNVLDIPVGDQTNIENICLGLAKYGHSLDSFDGIHTAYEFSLIAASTLAASCNLSYTPPKTLVGMRSKSIQKQILRSNGMRVAKTWYVDSLSDMDDSKILFPCILKPIAGAGTMRTKFINSQKELDDFFNESTNLLQQDFLLEEYLSGQEFILDGWIINGDIKFHSLGKYRIPCIEQVTSGENLIMYRCEEIDYPGLEADATAMAEEALNSLNYKTGLFHLEFFWNGEELIFSECAARRGGAAIEEEIRISRGISLADASIDFCLGSAPSAITSTPILDSKLERIGSVHPKLPAGTLIDLPNMDVIRKTPGLKYSSIHTHLGKASRGHAESTADSDAVFVMGAPTLNQLDIILQEVQNAFYEGARVIPLSSGKDARFYQNNVMGRHDLVDSLLQFSTNNTSSS